jgi:hypothetical protein
MTWPGTIAKQVADKYFDNFSGIIYLDEIEVLYAHSHEVLERMTGLGRINELAVGVALECRPSRSDD